MKTLFIGGPEGLDGSVVDVDDKYQNYNLPHYDPPISVCRNAHTRENYKSRRAKIISYRRMWLSEVNTVFVTDELDLNEVTSLLINSHIKLKEQENERERN